MQQVKLLHENQPRQTRFLPELSKGERGCAAQAHHFSHRPPPQRSGSAHGALLRAEFLSRRYSPYCTITTGPVPPRLEADKPCKNPTLNAPGVGPPLGRGATFAASAL